VAAAGNAKETKARILEAAFAEFSAYGIAGARVERIAKAAGCNKNLLYIYFDNKENLFTTVLEQNLERVYTELAFTPDDLPGFGARVFDFAMSHRDLMRLMLWSSLEQQAGTVVARKSERDSNIAAIESSQKDGQLGNGFSPGFLMTVIMTLATGWSAASPFGVTLSPHAADNPEELRKSIAAAIGLLAAARKDEG
jgi:AcrR family transcriptional regulator